VGDELAGVDLMGGTSLIRGSSVSTAQGPLANDGYHSMAFHNALGDSAFLASTTTHAFTGNAPFTVACWLKLNAFNAGSGHWAVNKLDGTNGWSIACNGASQIEFQRGANTDMYSPGSSIVGRRMFVAIRYDGTTLHGNVDGSDISAGVASAGSLTAHLNPFCIGSYGGGGSGWEGPIDEVMVWNSDIGASACATISAAGDFPIPQAGPRLIVVQGNRAIW